MLFWHSCSNSHALSVLPLGSASFDQSAVPAFLDQEDNKWVQSSKQTPLPVLQLGSLTAKAEAFIVTRKRVVVCDWGKMKQNVMKGQVQKGERRCDIHSSYTASPARLHGFPVRKGLEAKLKAATLAFTADLLHGLEMYLDEVGTTSVTSIMLFAEVSFHPNSCLCCVCYISFIGKQ